jgi:hypothetical protein
MGLTDETWLALHGGHRRIIRMKGVAYARLFRCWQHLFQKSLQAPPQFLL